MTSIKNSPAIAMAFRFLQDALAKGTWKNGDRLPTLADLARNARVSRTSMWQALKRAKKAKLLTVIRGGVITAGILLSPVKSDHDLHASDSRKIWLKKRDSLQQDILNGVFSEQGILPPKKVLQATYGITPSTLRKVLFSLADMGIISAHGKTYQIRMMGNRLDKRSILLLSEWIEGAPRRHISDLRLEKLVNALEMTCAHANISVVGEDFEIHDPASDVKIISRFRKHESIMGSIFIAPWTADKNSETRIIDLIGRLAAIKKPLAIFDSVGTLSPSPKIGVGANLQIFRIAARFAGRQVAKRLLGLGHTRVVFLSHVHGSVWSKERLAGIIDLYNEAGFKNAVVPVVVDNIEVIQDKTLWLANLPPQKVQEMLKMRVLPEPSARSIGSTKNRKASSSSPLVQDKALSDKMAAILRLVKNGIDSKITNAVRDMILAESARQRGISSIESLFIRAIEESQCTAWILANDGLAGNALDFLRNQSIRVPSDLSIIGFDNMPESFELNLTTYDFNMTGIMNRMLWFIRQYDDRRISRVQAPIEVEGMVIERGTTGKAREVEG